VIIVAADAQVERFPLPELAEDLVERHDVAVAHRAARVVPVCDHRTAEQAAELLDH
jgi:hypothetical protein